jgi:hypothetical protein
MFQPTTPKMGGLVQVSSYEWCTGTGGKPKADWSGLDPAASTFPLHDFQYRPSSPGSSQKITKYSEYGLETKFTRKSHLLHFIDGVTTYMEERTGMDTIAYLPDPFDPTKVASVVTQYSQFDLQDAIIAARQLRSTEFDPYDYNNDESAKNWFMNSIDPELKKDIIDRMSSIDGFVCYWLQMIALIQSTSFNPYESIKRDIQDKLTIFRFPQQSVKALSTEFFSRAKELDDHGFYEHRLTLRMLNRFLEGGGSAADVSTAQYRYTLFQLPQDLDCSLIKIGRLPDAAKNQYMAKEGLTYRDICSRAELEW